MKRIYPKVNRPLNLPFPLKVKLSKSPVIFNFSINIPFIIELKASKRPVYSGLPSPVAAVMETDLGRTVLRKLFKKLYIPDSIVCISSKGSSIKYFKFKDYFFSFSS